MYRTSSGAGHHLRCAFVIGLTWPGRTLVSASWLDELVGLQQDAGQVEPTQVVVSDLVLEGGQPTQAFKAAAVTFDAVPASANDDVETARAYALPAVTAAAGDALIAFLHQPTDAALPQTRPFGSRPVALVEGSRPGAAVWAARPDAALARAVPNRRQGSAVADLYATRLQPRRPPLPVRSPLGHRPPGPPASD